MTRTTILIQVIVNLVFGILVLLVVRRYMKYGNITIDIGAWGVFYTVFGVLYAIIIGFILIATLDKFDNLKLFSYKETVENDENEVFNLAKKKLDPDYRYDL